MSLRQVDLELMINRVIRRYRPGAKVRGVYLESVVDVSAPPVFADPDYLQQVIHQHIETAIDASKKGESVSVGLFHYSRGVELSITHHKKRITIFLPK